MDFLIAVLMILLGVGLAGAIALVAVLMSNAESNRAAAAARGRPDRDTIAASLVYQIGAFGAAGHDRIVAFLREEGRLVAPITRDIHIGNWAEAYSKLSTREERVALLDLAVRTAVALSASLPLIQYNALLDLSFGLGFQTDALARLRARYRFEYTDYAKAGRPRSADRAGGAAPLFQRSLVDPQPMLNVLGLSGIVSRQELTSTYRRLAAQNHPDRFHTATSAEQESAAARFIQITEAYEQLLAISAD